MADRNKVDYYSVLGVPRTSTPEEIKAAYRTRAKELHPDKNRAENATARFQQLQEAFSILGSPERRLLYDQGNYAAAVDPATQATEAEFDPVPCDGCRCISAQPRFVQYDRVISIIVASYKIRPAGVFCPTCASKRLFINTLITGAVGWLGFWGIFWSIAAVIRNISGGTKSPGVNAFLLGKQAAYFMQQGKADLGYALANESLEFFKKAGAGDSDYALGKSGAEIARYILNQSTSKRVRLRSRWAGWPVPARYALAGLAVPAVFWAAIFNSSEGTKRQPQSASSYARSSAPAVTSAPPAEQYVDMTGKMGILTVCRCLTIVG